MSRKLEKQHRRRSVLLYKLSACWNQESIARPEQKIVTANTTQLTYREFAERGVLNLLADRNVSGSSSAWTLSVSELSFFGIDDIGRIGIGSGLGFLIKNLLCSPKGRNLV